MQYILTQEEYDEYEQLKYKPMEEVKRDSSLLDETKQFFSSAKIRIENTASPQNPFARVNMNIVIDKDDIPENYYNLIRGITNEFKR